MNARLERKLRFAGRHHCRQRHRGYRICSRTGLHLSYRSRSRYPVWADPQRRDRGYFAVRPRRSDAWLARRPFVHSQFDGAKRDLRGDHCRTVDSGFLASGTAMERFSSMLPFAIRDLGRLPIRGRADGIDVVGIDEPNGSPESIAAKLKAYDRGGG